ncbi:MAG: hypothetical protein Kow0022_09300 [Phycisphaerales bacterium]
MRRLIHLFMSIDREKPAEAERDTGFDERLRAATETLQNELHTALADLAERLSQRNRMRAQVDRLRSKAASLQAEADRLTERDQAKASELLSAWAQLQPAIDAAAEQLDQLNSTCVSAESRVAELRHRIEESRRNASTLIARRSAARAQQRLADAVAAGCDQPPDPAAPSFDRLVPDPPGVETESDRLGRETGKG